MSKKDGAAFMRFAIDQRVKFSAEGREACIGISKRLTARTIGTVVGFNRAGDCVWVLWDHFATRQRYHEKFIDLA